MSVRAAKIRGTWAQKGLLNSFSIVIFQANHMYTFRFEANAQLVRLQLRSRNAVEGPERSRAVVERAKQQWRYFLFLHNVESCMRCFMNVYLYTYLYVPFSMCLFMLCFAGEYVVWLSHAGSMLYCAGFFVSVVLCVVSVGVRVTVSLHVYFF